MKHKIAFKVAFIAWIVLVLLAVGAFFSAAYGQTPITVRDGIVPVHNLRVEDTTYLGQVIGIWEIDAGDTMPGYLPMYMLPDTTLLVGGDTALTTGNIGAYAPATNLGYTAATRVLTSSTGTDVTLPLSSSTAPGLLPTLGTSLQLARVNSAGTSLEYFTPSYLTAVTGTARFSGSGTSGSPLELAQQSAATGQGLGWNGAYWAPWTFFHTASSRFSGAGTAASPLEIAQQGATSGQVLTWNGTSWAPAAPSGGVTGSGTTNYLPKWSGSTALGNSLIYDSGTNIGIGTTSPVVSQTGTGLHFYSGTLNAGLRLSSDFTNGTWCYIEYANAANTVSYIQGVRGSDMSYRIIAGTSLGATTGITLNSSGQVGIGTASQADRLSVSGDALLTGVLKLADGTAANPAQTFSADLNTGVFRPTADVYAISTGGSERLRVDASGRVMVGVQSSSNTIHFSSSAQTSMRVNSYGSVAADGGEYLFARGRGSSTSPTTILANDAIAKIMAQGHDGTDFRTSSYMLLSTEGTVSSGNVPGKIGFWTVPVGGGTTAVERMVISPGGNIGIGITNPSYALQVVNNGTTGFSFTGSQSVNMGSFTNSHATGYGLWVQANGYGIYGSQGANGGTTYFSDLASVTAGTGTALQVRPKSTQTAGSTLIAVNDLANSVGGFFAVKGDGKVGIGTASPAQALHVVGNLQWTGAAMPNGSAGTAGQVLTSAGAGAPPTWGSAGTIGGTAAANRVAYGDGSNSLTSSANFTYTSGVLEAARSAGASIRVAYSAGSVYTDIGTNSSGYGFLSPTGKRLGVNTTAPLSTLHLQNDGTNTQGGLFIDHNSGTMSTGNELQLDLALGGTAMARVAAVKESTGYGLKFYTGGAGAVNGAAAIAITGADDITIGTTASTASINFQGPLGTDDYQTETANSGTLAAKSWHYIDPTGAAAWTLPGSMNDGTWLFVVNQDGTFDITISAPGGETLTGSATITAGKTGMFHKSGTVWYRITF